eukprot:TRINITY_DN2270_c0_g1_i1.p1 TRINITY_DN2270_c0_g1~~TRINITY_DN2270_c0_g1_i1.p1  ORF type:complete len:194 (+),score=56.27 TRINITY_DN2270_c0_g1_i1:29-583(+)
MQKLVAALVALCLVPSEADTLVAVQEADNNKWPFEGLLKRQVSGQAVLAAKKHTKPKGDSESKEDERDEHPFPFDHMTNFGDVDTAEELTNSSKKETEKMVDQLEKAQVAEEKRAVFRSLTRLRGVAISSFDSIAQAHAANVDKFNKEHKWSKDHPLKQLASQESDVKSWAFPKDADLLQTKSK